MPTTLTVNGQAVTAHSTPNPPPLGAARRARAHGHKVRLHDWVRIAPDGSVTLYISVQEMGQGAWCVHARILGEELGLGWDQIRVEQSPPTAVYGIFSPGYATGGSASVREMYSKLRKVGAAARAMLVEAAAERWSVPPGRCSAMSGEVIHNETRRKLGFASRPCPGVRERPC